MTYMEIIEEIAAFNRRHEMEAKEEMRIRAQMDYKLANLIGISVNEPTKYPKSLQKAYPELFKESKTSNITWQEHKSQFARYAEEFNRQRGGL